MDVDLLARMVGELVLDHDCVGLPGLGTFVAEDVPASFSDRGFTINPPYRKLSFHSGRPEDDSLIMFYASRNSVEYDVARAILVQYLTEMKEVLKDRKVVVLPGLGRLRATKENNFFFVADQDLDISPDGFGLEPVSLRFHTPLPEADLEPAPLASVPAPEPIQPEQTPEQTPEPVPDPDPEPTQEPVSEPTPAPDPEPTPEPASEPTPEPAAPVRRKRRRWWIPFVVLIALAAIGLAVFMILVQVAPDFIDSILYTPEELRIINY